MLAIRSEHSSANHGVGGKQCRSEHSSANHGFGGQQCFSHSHAASHQNRHKILPHKNRTIRFSPFSQQIQKNHRFSTHEHEGWVFENPADPINSLILPSEPKAVKRRKTKVLELELKKNSEEMNCGLESKTKYDENPKVSKAEHDARALNGGCTITPKASSIINWKFPCCETPLSPRIALRAAMLKHRFAETILKAQKRKLKPHSDGSDPAKVGLEKEVLKMKKREERAIIDAQMKAAEATSKKKDEIEVRERLEGKREEARVFLQKMEKTAGIERNVEIVMELEKLSGGKLIYSPLESPLRQFGLFMKYDICDLDMDTDVIRHPE